MLARSQRRLAATLLASTVLVGVSVPSATASAEPPAAADTALDWVEGELAADGGFLTTSYQGNPNVESFDDWGLTIDAVLALAAGGRGGGAAATTAADLVETNIATYITGGFDPTERYAGAIAKALLMAEVQGEDAGAFGGYDLETELRDRMQTTGDDAGRFSDQTGFGDFSNGFGQALAVMALARTSAGVPSAAADFLLAQQCPGGGFRGDYTTPGGCTDDADATVDATGFALQALTALEPACDTNEVIADAVGWLEDGQTASGAFGAESGSNTNSTGLAAVALRSLGATDAADAAAAFITGLQLTASADAGAVALNQDAFSAAGDGVQILERDGFRRATTQGVLALGLPSYAEIGTTAIDPADFAPCVTPSSTTTTAAPPVTVAGVDAKAPQTLPVTGRSTRPQAATGIALVGLGALLVAGGRRRRRSSVG